MNFSTSKKVSSNELTNIRVDDIYTGTTVTLEELGNKVYEREQNKFSSIEINQHENWHLFLDGLYLLTQDEYDEEFLAPTDFAYQTIGKFLKSLSETFDRPLPIPNFIPDGEGGIRAEWNVRGKEIRMVCPAKPDWKPYVYFEEGDFYDIEKDVKTGNFIKRFNWLLN